MKLLVSLISLVAICGCSSLDKVSKNLAKDNAAVGAHVVTTMGNGDFWRANPMAGHNLKITRPDGTVIDYVWVGPVQQANAPVPTLTNAVAEKVTVSVENGHLKFSPK